MNRVMHSVPRIRALRRAAGSRGAVVAVAAGAADALRDAAHGYYRYLHANRDTARLMASRRTSGPNLTNLLDGMLGRLHAAGFSDADAARATLLIATYVQGYVLQEQQPTQRIRMSRRSWR